METAQIVTESSKVNSSRPKKAQLQPKDEEPMDPSTAAMYLARDCQGYTGGLPLPFPTMSVPLILVRDCIKWQLNL
jgi:hypothetical protein